MLSFLNMLSYQSRLHAEDDERLFRAAIDVSPTAVVITDATRPDDPVLYVNEQFCRITGYAPDEVLGRNLRMLQGPATSPSDKARVRRDITEHRPVSAELVNYRKDGRPFWMRMDITPVFDEEGQVVRHVGVMRDVTTVHRDAELLREREERLEAIAGAIPLPVVIVDFVGTVLQANTHAEQILECDALVGRRLDELFDGAQLFEQLRRDGRVQQLEVAIRTAVGELRWVLASAVRFRMDRKDAAIVVFVDIGEQKRKEEELARARDDAERAIRAKSRFFAAASHDLRQPLQALALFSSALEQHVTTPTAHNILSSIKLSLSTMEEMFDALLDMSRLEAGVLTPQPEVFLVNDVLERLEVEFAPQVARKDLILRVVPSSAAVRSDPALLSRIVRNFLSNAVRYTQKGSILLGCKRHGGALRIVVADTGPGIPEDQRLAIFEEFFQGSERPTKSGLGLGLAIVQRLACLLHHHLNVLSRPGHGAMFSVEVPLADEPAAILDVEDEDEALGDLTGSCVLVIDDDPAVRQSVLLLLEDWGCRVISAESGAEAVALVSEGGTGPDVILADLRLPEAGGGMGAIEGLLGVLGDDVPAFLFTGDTDMRDGESGPSGRIFRVLHKPINPLRLRAVLAEAMGRPSTRR